MTKDGVEFEAGMTSDRPILIEGAASIDERTTWYSNACQANLRPGRNQSQSSVLIDPKPLHAGAAGFAFTSARETGS